MWRKLKRILSNSIYNSSRIFENFFFLIIIQYLLPNLKTANSPRLLHMCWFFASFPLSLSVFFVCNFLLFCNFYRSKRRKNLQTFPIKLSMNIQKNVFCLWHLALFDWTFYSVGNDSRTFYFSEWGKNLKCWFAAHGNKFSTIYNDLLPSKDVKL